MSFKETRLDKHGKNSKKRNDCGFHHSVNLLMWSMSQSSVHKINAKRAHFFPRKPDLLIKKKKARVIAV